MTSGTPTTDDPSRPVDLQIVVAEQWETQNKKNVRRGQNMKLNDLKVIARHEQVDRDGLMSNRPKQMTIKSPGRYGTRQGHLTNAQPMSQFSSIMLASAPESMNVDRT